MTVLDVNSVTKRFESDPIFTRVSFKVSRGQKVGLIGENGCGKSTLLKMIAGVETPTDGVVTRPGNSSVGYLAKQMQYGEGNTVYQELLGVFDEVRNMGRKLADLEADMSDPTVSTDPVRLQRTMDRYGELAAEFERLGGYAFEHRIDAVMEGLRISHLRDQPVHTLSGGEKNITALARILLQEPQILLLDEPANHLDFAGLAWLEEFLRTYSKTVILVSHNRYLLDRVVERILEIEDDRIAEYRGNYSAYRAEKLKALLSQKHAFDDQQKEISRLQEMIKRFEHWASASPPSAGGRKAGCSSPSSWSRAPTSSSSTSPPTTSTSPPANRWRKRWKSSRAPSW